MANGNQLPDGFVLDSQPAQQVGGVPDGFVLDDQPQPTLSAEQQPANEPSPDFFGAGVIEPLMAVGAGVGTSIAGGLAGTAQALNPFADEGAGAEVVRDIQGSAYQPRTEAGQQGMKTLGDLIQVGVDIVNYPLSGIGGLIELVSGQGVDKAAQTIRDIQSAGISKTMGDRTMEATGSPLAATIAETLPDALGVAAGIGAAKSAAGRLPARREIARKIAAGSDDVSTAGYNLKKGSDPRLAQTDASFTDDALSLPPPATGGFAPKSKQPTPASMKDPIARKAMTQGFDEGFIASVKASSPADWVKMEKMVDVLEKSKKSATYRMDNRPADIAGASFLDRYKYVTDVNKAAGYQLDDIAKRLKGKPVDVDAPVGRFNADLEDMGVKINDDLTLDFTNSDIQGMTKVENLIARVYDRMANTRVPDAYDVHRIKRYLDRQVSYEKTAEGADAAAEIMLKRLRRGLDEQLDGKFKEYDRVNTKYSDTINAINAFKGVAGKKMDMAGKNADKAVGTLLRRLMSNAQSRVPLMDSVKLIEEVSKKYGRTFNDKLNNQLMFAEELDRMFGAPASTSFKGQIEQAAKKGVEVAADPGQTAIGLAIKASEKFRGLNEENAIKSIKALLKDRRAKAKAKTKP